MLIVLIKVSFKRLLYFLTVLKRFVVFVDGFFNEVGDDVGLEVDLIVLD